MPVSGDAPILQHLRGRLYEVAYDSSPMEARELRAAQQAVKDVTHFVEKRDDIVVTHQCWTIRSRFGYVGNHRSQWIPALAIWSYASR